MKLANLNRLVTILAVALLGFLLAPQSVFAHGSAQAMKAFMEPYGKIQLALAADDLSGAQAAAKALPLDKDAQAIAAGKTLDDARAAFKLISKKAIGIAGGDGGYFLFKCSMVDEGYWIQTSTKVANPYLGKSMPGCGELLSKEEALKVAPSADAAGTK